MNKYRNVKTVVDGIKFDSKREAARYQELKLLQKAKKITDLKLQPKYPIMVNEGYGLIKVCDYVADFFYIVIDHPDAPFSVVEDVKSKPTMTPIYRLKKKLMKAIYNLDIKEIK